MNSEYLQMFIEETEENLQSLNDNSLLIEKNPENIEIIQVMFRAAHTIKGMAGTMGFKKMQLLTHHLENEMDDIRNKKTMVTEIFVSILLEGIEKLEGLLNEIKTTGQEQTEVTELIKKIENYESTTVNEKIEKVSLNTYMFELNQLEIHQIEDIKRKEGNIWNVNLKLKEDTVLKKVRILMFAREIHSLGEIIKTYPEEEYYEEEDFDGNVHFLIATNEDKEKIENLRNKISKVESINAEE